MNLSWVLYHCMFPRLPFIFKTFCCFRLHTNVIWVLTAVNAVCKPHQFLDTSFWGLYDTFTLPVSACQASGVSANAPAIKNICKQHTRQLLGCVLLSIHCRFLRLGAKSKKRHKATTPLPSWLGWMGNTPISIHEHVKGSLLLLGMLGAHSPDIHQSKPHSLNRMLFHKCSTCLSLPDDLVRSLEHQITFICLGQHTTNNSIQENFEAGPSSGHCPHTAEQKDQLVFFEQVPVELNKWHINCANLYDRISNENDTNQTFGDGSETLHQSL